jgi:hypothetical protein
MRKNAEMKAKTTRSVRKGRGSTGVALTDSQVTSVRTLAKTVIGWTRVNTLIEELQTHGSDLDPSVNWKADFDKILRLSTGGRIPMQDHHRTVLRLALRTGLCAKLHKTDAELDQHAAALNHRGLSALLTFLDTPLPRIAQNSAPAQAVLTASRFPQRVLKTKYGMPQWADHWEIPLNGGLLGSIKCAVETSSPYFRFGLKLLTSEGEVFGEAAIRSQEAANMLVHIGRNNFERPEISAKDIFLTVYRNGIAATKDQKLFASKPRLQASVNLSVEDGSAVSFSVNGNCCCRGAIPPSACRRVVMLGWGDREEFEIKVTEIRVTTLK